MAFNAMTISFPQDKMTLRVPVTRASISGLRTLANKTSINEVYNFSEDDELEFLIKRISTTSGNATLIPNQIRLDMLRVA